LRNGRVLDAGAFGGAVSVTSGNGTLTITGCVFDGNEARGTDGDTAAGTFTQFAWGGALFVFSHTVHVVNNVFVGNRARGGRGVDSPGAPGPGAHAQGGAIHFAGTGSIVNNTFVGNEARGGDGGSGPGVQGAGGAAAAGAVRISGNPAPIVHNNIFHGNAATSGAGVPEDEPLAGALLADPATVRNSLFFANTIDGVPSSGDALGTAAVLADPRFHAPPDQLRLRNSSPARQAAHAATAPPADFFGAARPSPPAIGAFEAAFVAQVLQFGAAPMLGVGSSAGIVATGGGSTSPIVFASLTPATCSVTGSTVSGIATGTCTVSANRAGDVDHTAAAQVQQSFTVLSSPTFTLSVTRSGAGAGNVTSAPAGIACGSSCSTNFASGTSVTLSAAAGEGSKFGGWSGAGCSGTGTCVVSMTAARTVDAQFVVDTDRVFRSGFEP
jgi:hypothetical protein